MTKDRFEDLAQAYGGDVVRWPADIREEAAALMAAEPAFTRGVLADAGALDAALDAVALAPAARGLADRIVASAPSARPQRRWRSWFLPAGLGAGLAAACAAGVIVGAQAAPAPADSGDSTLISAAVDLDVSGLPEEV